MSELQLFPALDPATEAALRASINRFGVIVPVLEDQHGRIIDGHHRSRIATELGFVFERHTINVANDDEALEIARTVNVDRRHLDVDQRREVVAELRAQGHSLRAIGGALGVSAKTVHQDLTTVTEVTVPERVVGRDGKSRPATRSKPSEPVEEPARVDPRSVEPGDVVTDDSGDSRQIAMVEVCDELDEVTLFDEDGDALVVGVDTPVAVAARPAITKPDLGGGISHPARFSDALLPVFAQAVPADQFPLVLDPFAGTGRVHELANDTIGVELEPEWANLHPDTIVANASNLPFPDATFDAIVTSPAYGNRLADSHNAADPHLRRSYTHDLGRKLHADNSGSLQWGIAYQRLHENLWTEALRVLRPGGRFVLNIKDHVRRSERQHVAGWHVTTLITMGLDLLWCEDVRTGNLRQGENAELRFPEQVFVFEAATS